MKHSAEHLISLLRERGYTVTTAESCTGGLVSAALTSVSGASEVLEGAIVTYSPAVKAKFLSIDPLLLEREGVVSAACAKSMAEGAAKLFSADCAIALTGYAGPGGGDEQNPVGTVYIAAALHENTAVCRLSLTGDREEIRRAAAKQAIELLCRCIERD